MHITVIGVLINPKYKTGIKLHVQYVHLFTLFVQHVTGTGSGLLGGIPRVVVQISALTLKGPL
jgi:hypothetical protein